MYLIKLLSCLLAFLSWTLLTFFYNLQHIIISQLTKVWILCSKSSELNWSTRVQFLEYIYILFLQRWVEATFLFEALPYSHRSMFESWIIIIIIIAAVNNSNFTTESYLWLERPVLFWDFLMNKLHIQDFEIQNGCRLLSWKSFSLYYFLKVNGKKLSWVYLWKILTY